MHLRNWDHYFSIKHGSLGSKPKIASESDLEPFYCRLSNSRSKFSTHDCASEALKIRLWRPFIAIRNASPSSSSFPRACNRDFWRRSEIKGPPFSVSIFAICHSQMELGRVFWALAQILRPCSIRAFMSLVTFHVRKCNEYMNGPVTWTRGRNSLISFSPKLRCFTLHFCRSRQRRYDG